MGPLDDDELRAQLGNVIGRKDTGAFVEEPIARYRRLLPEADGGELLGEVFTDFTHQGAVACAEAKRAGGGAPAHRAFAQRSSRDRFTALGARRDRATRWGNARAAAGADRAC